MWLSPKNIFVRDRLDICLLQSDFWVPFSLWLAHTSTLPGTGKGNLVAGRKVGARVEPPPGGSDFQQAYQSSSSSLGGGLDFLPGGGGFRFSASLPDFQQPQLDHFSNHMCCCLLFVYHDEQTKAICKNVLHSNHRFALFIIVD